jgi:hypothetical protein
MNFKEFFKPTLGKVALFVLIFLLVPLPVYIANPGCPMMVKYNGCTPYWSFQHFISYGVNWVSFELVLGEFMPYIAMNLVISYILSCAAFGVAKKFMKKKGK